jgi:3-oxoacyl-[acyl-carrier protein] reductase
MLARGETDLAQAAEVIRAAHRADVLPLAADVTSPEDIARVVRETAGRWGRIDVLFANGGGPPPGVFADMDDARWQAAFELTLLSVVRFVREVAPHMRRAGGGSIVLLQSASVKMPLTNMILSNSLRAGVAGLAKTLSQELGPEGIRVNTVLPGAVVTDRLRRNMAALAAKTGRSVEEVLRQREQDIPLRRLGTPAEVASLAVFLASERASYLTGAAIQVDGGAVKSLT